MAKAQKNNYETNEDVLKIIYTKAPDVNYEIVDGNVFIIRKQDYLIQRFFRKLGVRIPEVKKMELDDKISFVFKKIDGTNSIEELGNQLKAEYGEDAEPLYPRLLLMISHLEKNEKIIEKIPEHKE